MFKFLRYSGLLIIFLSLCSWGRTGHQAIGHIAEAHLTPKTAQAIRDLLGPESLAGASTYADEIRTDSFFSFTAPWHYIDVPAHEKYDQFKISVYNEPGQNLYRALTHWEMVLQSPHEERAVRIFALKMIVHLVGDMHQPLHVARAEDKGGNDIQVIFEGKETNLHALWDSGLIGKTGMNPNQLAKAWDTASPQTILEWQSEPLIQTLYVSNHISNHIYDDLPTDRKLEESYYQKNISMIWQRVEQAGIRLAGILNQAFDLSMGSNITGDTTVCYKVFGGKFLEGSQITFLNLGAAYPDQKISVVIKGGDRSKFKQAPELIFDQKTICVTGSFQMYKGKPEIIVKNPGQIVVKE